MKKPNKMNDQEQIINRVYTDEKLDYLVLSLLGVYKTPCHKLSKFFTHLENIKIPADYKTDFNGDDLANLPDITLNFDRFDAETTWVRSSEEHKNIIANRENVEGIDERLAKTKEDAKELLNKKNAEESEKQTALKNLTELKRLKTLAENYKCDDLFNLPEEPDRELLQPSDLNEYTKRLQKAIDNIYPLNSNADHSLIPVTILLPNSYPQEGTELEGKYSYWEFITINNEDDGDFLGFQSLAEEPSSFYGLRLFLVFKALGLATTNQSSNNLSNIFFDLINETPLEEHFTLLSSKKISTYKKIIKKIAAIESKLKKLDSKSVTARKYKELIKEKQAILDKTSLFLSAEEIKSSCYYSLPLDDLTQIDKEKFQEDVDSNPVYPTLSSDLYCPLYTTNKLEVEEGKPSPRAMRITRYMLSYLFPMTSGTAITFYIKSDRGETEEDDCRKIKAPLLILPDTWNKISLSLKKKNPKIALPDLSDTLLTTIANKLSAICPQKISTKLVNKLIVIMKEVAEELHASAEDNSIGNKPGKHHEHIMNTLKLEVPEEYLDDVWEALLKEIQNNFRGSSYAIHAQNLSKINLKQPINYNELELPKLSTEEEKSFRDECYRALHSSNWGGKKDFDRIIPPVSDLSAYDAQHIKGQSDG